VAVVWTDPAAVARALGDPGAVDDPYVAECVDASNAYCYRRRANAGYTDPPDGPAPTPDVALGATMYAVDLYRARGSADAFASFAELDQQAVTGGSWAQIRRLLGIGRAAVDTPADDPGVVLPFTRYRTWHRHPSMRRVGP
jgi:hypothetical protein